MGRRIRIRFCNQQNGMQKPVKALIVLLSLILFTSFADADNTPYTEVLQKNVHEGRVNYRELCKDSRFPSYLKQLSQTDPDRFTNANDELAFWINAYNAFTLKIICEHYPVKSINELHTGGRIIGHLIKETIWDKKLVLIHGEEVSLNHI